MAVEILGLDQSFTVPISATRWGARGREDIPVKIDRNNGRIVLPDADLLAATSVQKISFARNTWRRGIGRVTQ